MKDIGAWILVGVAALAIVGALLGPSETEPRPAPAFSLVNLDGDVVSLSDFEGRVVLLDFWASWCKNCEAMERTTFREDEVRARLSSYVRVKVRAEDLNAPDTREKLDAFGVIGLPTYVVLQPAS